MINKKNRQALICNNVDFQKRKIKLQYRKISKDDLGQLYKHSLNVVEIIFDHCSFESEILHDLALFKWKYLSQLRFCDCSLSQNELCQIAQCMTQLENLQIADCQISGSSSFLQNQKMKNLKQLTLWTKNLSYEHLFSLGKFTKLEVLYLGQCKISCYGTMMLARNDWESLEQLHLWNNPLGDQGFKYLTSGNWSNLKKINLDFNHISNQGMNHFSEGNWLTLQKIEIQSNFITQEGTSSLFKISLNELNYLDLWGNIISTEKKSAIRFKIRDCFKNIHHIFI